jgi:hypothetical protein
MTENIKPDKLTSHEYDQIGRIATLKRPEFVKEIIEKYTPALTDLKHIPEICDDAMAYLPFVNMYDRNVLVVACIYQAYCPASFICNANAPAGMRKSIAKILGYEKGSNINYWQSIACAFMKNSRYAKVVNSIITNYKPIT